ncbi:MAG: hypothetical protein ABL974_02800 [Prosthecobacter sp.]
MIDQSDKNGLFLSCQSAASGRHAILEEQDGMVWLYLTASNATKPERDCPAFTTRKPTTSVDWEQIKKTGEPPSITQDVASCSAWVIDAKPAEFSAVWSSNGESVGIVRNGHIVCMIISGERFGHSRAIAKESPLGLPFDDDIARKTFPQSE